MGKTKKAIQTPVPSPDRFLNRNSVLGFAVFALFVLWAFWPSYFSQLDNQEIRLHLHGLALTLWCVMLILQAYQIRTKQKNIHRFVGKFSYVLVPIIVIVTINLVHYRMQGLVVVSRMDLFRIALMVNAVVVFVFLYGLAIYHRRTPALHARYMICTIFPLFTPVTDRLIYAHFLPLAYAVPVIDGTPIVQVVGFALADAILIGLSLWDWRSNRQGDAFPFALALLVAYHASVLTFYQADFWRSFGEWFLRLPLS